MPKQGNIRKNEIYKIAIEFILGCPLNVLSVLRETPLEGIYFSFVCICHLGITSCLEMETCLFSLFRNNYLQAGPIEALCMLPQVHLDFSGVHQLDNEHKGVTCLQTQHWIRDYATLRFSPGGWYPKSNSILYRVIILSLHLSSP